MTWFAQPTQVLAAVSLLNGKKETSPVIMRMLDGSCPVLLFLRGEGKRVQPYVSCGELDLLSQDLEQTPMKFLWKLREVKTLLRSAAFNQIFRETDD